MPFDITGYYNVPFSTAFFTYVRYELEFVENNGIVTPVETEPTEEPVEPTEEPVEPTEAPVEPTVAPTNEPKPNPPVTGAVSFVGLGIMAIAAGAGITIFRRKED